MNGMLTVGFNYRGDEYRTVILIKDNGAETNYKITVMNGALESLLIGNNIIEKKNGGLYLDAVPRGEVRDLKHCIGKALAQFLDLPVRNACDEEKDGC